MALPGRIEKSTPGDSDNPSAGAAQIRNLKGFLEDLFGVLDTQTYTAKAMDVGLGGQVTVGQSRLLFQNGNATTPGFAFAGATGTGLAYDSTRTAIAVLQGGSVIAHLEPQNHVSVWTYLSDAQRADVLAGTALISCSAAIQAAIDAAPVVGIQGSVVLLPPGNYLLATTLTIPSRVRLLGLGSQSTMLTYTGTGSAVTVTDGVYSGVSRLRIDTTSTAATVRALHLIATATNPQQPQVGTYEDLVLQAASLNAGQIGLYLDASAGGAAQATFNHFTGFFIQGFARPIVEVGGNEGNRFVDFIINEFGTGANGYGVESSSNLSQYLNFDFRLGGGTATATFGFRLTGQANVAIGIADLGAAGALYSVTGNDNTVLGQVITPSTMGTYSGAYTLALGRSRGQSGGAEVTASSTTGADRDIFRSAVAGFSNGFDIQYQEALPQAMRYSFLDGPVGLGVLPSFAGTPGPYTRVIATDSLPAGSADNDGLILIEDAGAGDRNLVFYAGAERFRLDGGTAF
jgi:hypothetical protein